MAALPAIRQRILEQPQLFLKAQRQREPDPPADGVTALLRDLEMVAAITRRADRRLAGATVELDHLQCVEAQRKIERVLHELNRVAGEESTPARSPSKSMLSQQQRTTILELNAQQVSKREIARGY